MQITLIQKKATLYLQAFNFVEKYYVAEHKGKS